MRLPVKSLMRFKCVQRSWNLLIQSPTFVTAWHMHHQNDRRLMTLDEEEHKFNPCVTLLSCDDPIPARPLIKSLFPSSSMTKPLFYGHCNGVFCLFDLHSKQLILWNPATREVHAISPPLFPYHPPISHDYPALPVFGFGADPNSPNDFKVIHLNLDNYANSDSLAQIYNVSTRSWTLIHRHVFPTHDIFILNRNPSRYKALVNGVYHWIMSSNNIQTILCFDFHNNRFSKIKAPSVWWWRKKKSDDMAEINGSLAYVMGYKYLVQHKLLIWIMDQRGSWVKIINIGPIGPHVQIRGLWKNGSQVLGGKAGQLLTSYDRCDGNLVHEFLVKVPDNDCVFRVYEYVASIAPLSTEPGLGRTLGFSYYIGEETVVVQISWLGQEGRCCFFYGKRGGLRHRWPLTPSAEEAEASSMGGRNPYLLAIG